MQLYKARIVQVAYVIHYAGTSALEHSFTRRAWDKTHQYMIVGLRPISMDCWAESHYALIAVYEL